MVGGKYVFAIYEFRAPRQIIGLDFNDEVSIREFSELQSAELNLRYTVPMPHECLTAKLILGFRYINVNEQFDYFYDSNVADSVNVNILPR